MNRAVFIDRDGVINTEVMTKDIDDINILDQVPEALKILKNKGFKLIIVSNQPIIARGLATEEEIEDLHNKINEKIHSSSKVSIDKFYFCPHHPNADILKYRKNCECRKPSPGMILQAAKDFNIDLKNSWMIGDRIADIVAGKSAGCKTILIKSPHNNEFTISGIDYDKKTLPDFKADTLFESISLIY